MKKFNFYTKNKDGVDSDKTWYDSSNIVYSECLDYDGTLKTLSVVFKNGTQYEYNDVPVQDYLFFRDSQSQGKALNEYIKNKNYPYKKIEPMDIEELNEEFNFRYNGGVFVDYDGEHLKMRNNKDEVILEKETKINKEALNVICAALVAVGKDVKLITTEEFDKQEDELQGG